MCVCSSLCGGTQAYAVKCVKACESVYVCVCVCVMHILIYITPKNYLRICIKSITEHCIKMPLCVCVCVCVNQYLKTGRNKYYVMSMLKRQMSQRNVWVH